MATFLKCIVMWLLILWHKETLSVHCSIYVAPIQNPSDLKPDRNDTHVLVNGVARKLYHILNATAVVEQSRSSERLDGREGNRSLTEFLLKLYNEIFLYGNRSTIKEHSRSSEHLDSREGNRSLTEFLLKLYN
jgi:hypothetical protein